MTRRQEKQQKPDCNFTYMVTLFWHWKKNKCEHDSVMKPCKTFMVNLIKAFAEKKSFYFVFAFYHVRSKNRLSLVTHKKKFTVNCWGFDNNSRLLSLYNRGQCCSNSPPSTETLIIAMKDFNQTVQNTLRFYFRFLFHTLVWLEFVFLYCLAISEEGKWPSNSCSLCNLLQRDKGKSWN